MQLYIVKNDNSKARVQDDFVLGFRVMIDRQTDEFKMGQLWCEHAKLIISKEQDISNIKAFVTIEPSQYYFIDSVDITNDDYVEYNLIDFSHKFNAPFDYSDLLPSDNTGVTITAIMQRMASDLGITIGSTLYSGIVRTVNDVEVKAIKSCDPSVSYRTFLQWVGDFCYSNFYVTESINLTNTNGPTFTLQGVKFNRRATNPDERALVITEASDITIGDTLTITDVVCGIYHATNGTSDGYVYKMDPENIIITNYDTETAKQNKLQQVLTELQELRYTNMKISSYMLEPHTDSSNPHRVLQWWTELKVTFKGETYKAYNNVDWDFTQVDGATEWLDNFDKSLEFNIKTKTEADSSVTTDLAGKLRGIRTLISQTAEEIRLLAESENDEHERIESLISQTASEISLTVSEIENGLLKQSTTFVVESDGAYIKQGRDGYYSRFTDSGMEVYSNNQKIAEATADTFKAPSFTTDNWTIREEDNGNTLNFFRGNW